MIQFANQDDMDNHKKAQKARIYGTYKEANGRMATAITKGELDEKYPSEQWERYSLTKLNQFHTDLIKAEGTEADEIFKQATKDLVPFTLHEGGKKLPVFLRKKEEGE